MAEAWSASGGRCIAKRIVVEGDLCLQTPTAFANGDSGEVIDMPLLTDPLCNQPLLTGASLAGALRAQVRRCRDGSRLSALLFGAEKRDEWGEQSPLIIEDALGEASGVELRDGVAIAPETRTATQNALYSRELWAAGTTFRLRLELLICHRHGREPEHNRKHETDLCAALVTALYGLQNGDVTLGARKTRGYGRVGITEWRMRSFDLGTRSGLQEWLREGGAELTPLNAQTKKDISALLGPVRPSVEAFFHIEACFVLNGSLLIRTGGSDSIQPDMVHLRTRQWDDSSKPVPILSGTSLAGALRARAVRIALLAGKEPAFVEHLFGNASDRSGEISSASRLTVTEEVIHNPCQEGDMVQHRVAIDHFTGGARETALFNQQPVFGDADTTLKIHIRLHKPTEAEIGLALLLLKDLWTGDLPLGGETSVGRGRMQGSEATLHYRKTADVGQFWKLETIPRNANANDTLRFIEGNPADLQTFVIALHTSEEV